MAAGPPPSGCPIILNDRQSISNPLFQSEIWAGVLILRHHFPDAFSVLFTYLIAVKIIENFRGKPKDFGEAISVYGSSFIAAAALTFSDTMWFNSVESEVYATSLTFVALIVWLMMKRNEKADDPGHERYLLLIAYLMRSFNRCAFTFNF